MVDSFFWRDPEEFERFHRGNGVVRGGKGEGLPVKLNREKKQEDEEAQQWSNVRAFILPSPSSQISYATS